MLLNNEEFWVWSMKESLYFERKTISLGEVYISFKIAKLVCTA